MAIFSHILLILAAIGGAASVIALAAVLVSDEAWARWKNARRGSRAAFALAVVLAALYGGTKSADSRVNYPRTDSGTAYLTDAGSSVTNDAVVLNFTRSSLVPDDAWLFLDACPLSVTNAADVAANCVTVYSNQFSAISLPLTVAYENATNYVWYAYTDWTPGPVVHTNGVVNMAWLKAKGEMPPNAVRVVPLRTEVTPIDAKPPIRFVADDAAAGLADGDTVTAWADTTGKRIATQATTQYPADCPTIALDTFNGHAGIVLGKSALVLAPKDNPIATNYSWTVCAVVSTTNATASGRDWYASGGILGLEEAGTTCDWALILNGDRLGVGMGTWYDYTILAPVGTSYIDGVPHVVVASFDNAWPDANYGTLTLCVDGTTTSQIIAVRSSTGSPRNYAQCRFGYRSTERVFNGLLAEAQFYPNRALSADEIHEVGAWLAARYGATWTRPATE